RDGYLFGEPRFVGTDAQCLSRYAGDDSAAGSAGVLNDCHRMQVDDPCSQLPVFAGRWRCLVVRRLATGRIIESPVLHFPLTTLHHEAPGSLPRLAINSRIGFGEMEV